MADEQPKRPGHKGYRFYWERQMMAAGYLSTMARFVGLVAATHCDARNGDRIHPGEQAIMRESGLSQTAVRRALKELREAGWLIRTFHAKSKGLKLADEYTLTIGRTSDTAEVPVSQTGSTGLTDRKVPVSQTAQQTMCHTNVNSESKDSGSKQASTATKDQKWKNEARQAAAAARDDPDNADEIIDELFGGLQIDESSTVLGMLANGEDPLAAINTIAKRRRSRKNGSVMRGKLMAGG